MIHENKYKTKLLQSSMMASARSARFRLFCFKCFARSEETRLVDGS